MLLAIAIVVIFLIIVFLILPIFLYKKINDDIELNCSINSNKIVKGNGFFIVNNILDEKCREKLVNLFLEESKNNKKLNEDRQLTFYSNKKFLSEISNIVNENLYPVNSLDLQRCWLRYYFEGMNAQYYENYHHDVKRYNSNVKQYRLVIPIYDTSNSKFSIENYGEFSFTQNMGVFLEADNCLHKVNFNKGERLLLIMDFITKDCDSIYNHYSCRGPLGYYNWIKDSTWRKISSIYYKLVN